jgi:thiamine biosynthesis lipoprotein
MSLGDITPHPLQTPTARPAVAPAGETLRRLTFPAMGTSCEVQYVAPSGIGQALQFERAARGWVQEFEARYSRFQPTSLVSRINDAAGRDWVAIDRETEDLLQMCDSIFVMTAGVLDPTALPLIRLWNWKDPNRLLPSAAEIARARELVGWKKVQRAPGRVFLPVAGMALDFGGFGKEYAVDRVAQIALDHGIADALVDFGHDIRVLGRPPGRPAWHLGLENPHQPGRYSSSLALAGSHGVASSGDYIRCFHADGRRYGHILDPRTGRPVANGCMQATIIADTCLQAGVLSTAAFVLGVPQGLELVQSCPRAEGLIVTDNARAQTRGFHDYVTS